MRQNKTSQSNRAGTEARYPRTNSKPGISSLFKQPEELFQPSTESSKVFTKNHRVIRYK